MNRLASDTMVIQNAVTVNVSMGLRFGAQILIGLVLIFFESWKLSLMMLSIVPAIVGVAIMYVPIFLLLPDTRFRASPSKNICIYELFLFESWKVRVRCPVRLSETTSSLL